MSNDSAVAGEGSSHRSVILQIDHGVHWLGNPLEGSDPLGPFFFGEERLGWRVSERVPEHARQHLTHRALLIDSALLKKSEDIIVQFNGYSCHLTASIADRPR